MREGLVRGFGFVPKQPDDLLSCRRLGIGTCFVELVPLGWRGFPAKQRCMTYGIPRAG